MTLDEFLLWEERQELRWEFDGFAPVERIGGTVRHSLIQTNALAALVGRLRGKPCQAFGSSLKILVAGSVRYPDLFVACSAIPARATVVTEPVTVFEILSPETSAVDRVVKHLEYRDTPSVLRYVMLEQDFHAATVFARQGDDWVGHLLSGDAVLAMPEIGVEVPLSEFYEGVTFPDAAAEA